MKEQKLETLFLESISFLKIITLHIHFLLFDIFIYLCTYLIGVLH